MLTEFGKKWLFFMLVPEKVSRHPLLYRMLLWQLHLEWKESQMLSVRNRWQSFGWSYLLFTFQVRYAVESSAVLTSYPPAHLSSSPPPSVLLLRQLSTIFFPRLRVSVSFFLSVVFLCWLTPLSRCLMSLFCMSKQHTLICPANRKPDGSLVRQSLHFNQASGQSNLCQSD